MFGYLKVIESYLLPQFFNTIQSYLFTERIQDDFLNDCTSKHVGPTIVSCKGFYRVSSHLKPYLIVRLMKYCRMVASNTLHNDTAYRRNENTTSHMQYSER